MKAIVNTPPLQCKYFHRFLDARIHTYLDWSIAFEFAYKATSFSVFFGSFGSVCLQQCLSILQRNLNILLFTKAVFGTDSIDWGGYCAFHFNKAT